MFVNRSSSRARVSSANSRARRHCMGASIYARRQNNQSLLLDQHYSLSHMVTWVIYITNVSKINNISRSCGVFLDVMVPFSFPPLASSFAHSLLLCKFVWQAPRNHLLSSKVGRVFARSISIGLMAETVVVVMAAAAWWHNRVQVAMAICLSAPTNGVAGSHSISRYKIWRHRVYLFRPDGKVLKDNNNNNSKGNSLSHPTLWQLLAACCKISWSLIELKISETSRHVIHLCSSSSL